MDRGRRYEASRACLARDILGHLSGYIVGAVVDQSGQIAVDVSSTGESYKRPGENVASLSEWIALVVVITKCECLLVVGLRGDQRSNELYSVVRELRSSQNEQRAAFP